LSCPWLLCAPGRPSLYSLSLHDALPIYGLHLRGGDLVGQPDVELAVLDVELRGQGALVDVLRGPAQIGVDPVVGDPTAQLRAVEDRKSTRLNSSHVSISYAVFCLKKKTG